MRINLFRRFIVHADFYGLSDIDSVVTDFDPNKKLMSMHDRSLNDIKDMLKIKPVFFLKNWGTVCGTKKWITMLPWKH